MCEMIVGTPHFISVKLLNSFVFSLLGVAWSLRTCLTDSSARRTMLSVQLGEQLILIKCSSLSQLERKVCV